MLGMVFWWLFSSFISLVLTAVVLSVALSSAKSYWRHGEVRQSVVLDDFRHLRDKTLDHLKAE